MKISQDYHYVYKITNNNPSDERQYYIGVRTCKNCLPEEDTNYMGSSTSLTENINEIGKNNFSKEILSVWKTRKEANEEEIRLHTELDVTNNSKYYNKANAHSTMFCTHGQVTVTDTRDGKTKNVSSEEYQKFDYYVSITTGKVTALDERDNKTKQVTITEFHNNDYYRSCTKGQSTIIDNRNGKIKNVTHQEFKNNPYFVGLKKNIVTAFDIKHQKTKNVSIEEFRLDDNLIGFKKNKVVVFDTIDKINKVINNSLLDNDRYVSLIKNKVMVKNLISEKNEIIPVSTFKNFRQQYIALSSNRTTVIDTLTNTQKSVSINEYKNNKNLIHIMDGNVTVIDIRDGKIKHVNKNDFNTFEYYVSINSKKIAVYKNDDTLFKISYGNFAKFCKLHNLSITALTKSYKTNESPIFLNISNIAKSKLIAKKREFQIGWYAKEIN